MLHSRLLSILQHGVQPATELDVLDGDAKLEQRDEDRAADVDARLRHIICIRLELGHLDHLALARAVGSLACDDDHRPRDLIDLNLVPLRQAQHEKRRLERRSDGRYG